jgi:hypothetical protein
MFTAANIPAAPPLLSADTDTEVDLLPAEVSPRRVTLSAAFTMRLRVSGGVVLHTLNAIAPEAPPDAFALASMQTDKQGKLGVKG